MDKQDKNKILQSQGIRFVPPDPVLKPKNKLIDPLSASVRRPEIKREENAELKREVEEKKEEPQIVPEISIKKSSPKRRRLIKNIFILILLVFSGYSSFVAYQKYGFPEIFAPKSLTPEQVVKEVGKIIDLPQNEEPTIMTVTDPEALSGKEFFRNAKVGDKVLIYSESRKIILYRPSDKRVIASTVIED